MQEPDIKRSFKTKPPSAINGRVCVHARPSMKTHRWLFLGLVSFIIPEAIAYISSLESLSDDVGLSGIGQLPTSTAEGKNVAFHRPCRPSPLCLALVDSNQGTAVIVDNGHTFMPSSSAGNGQHPALSQVSRETFEIFLEQSVFVSHVVVLCSAGHSSHLGVPLRGTLLVTWTINNKSMRFGNGTGATRKTQRIAKEISIQPEEPGLSDMLKVSLQVDDMASAVTVTWIQAQQHDGGNASFRINEVMVMTQIAPGDAAGSSFVSVEFPDSQGVKLDADTADSLSSSDIMYMKSRLWTKGSSSRRRMAQNESLNMGSDEANAGEERIADMEITSSMYKDSVGVAAAEPIADVSQRVRIGRQKPRTTLKPSARMHTTLAPANSGADVMSQVPVVNGDVQLHAPREFLSQTVQLSQRSALGYLPHVLAALVAIAVIFSAIAPRAAVAYFCLRCRKGGGYQALELEDPEAPAIHTTLQRTRLQEFFNLGSHGDGLESPRFPRRAQHSMQGTPPLTESEPEGELEPLMSADAFEEHRTLLSQLAPAPVVLGMREPLSDEASNTESQSNMFLAQCSRRVVLLYSSPLCYISPAQRPTALPQIPFEREWDVIVRSCDEANAALRIADQGHGRLSRRRSTAALEAQPLTAASLRRLVAPSPDPTRGNTAAVLHLSAHGIQDCLVAENGKTTAHFLSCSAIRGMLADAEHDKTPPVRMIVVNACSLRMLGDQFVSSGIPHVICSSAELRDSASHVFLEALYSSLFQGGTVKHAFSAALVALRSDPEASSRSAADSFYLLPEQAPHDEVIFWPTTSVSANVRATISAAQSPSTFKRESSSNSTRVSSSFSSMGSESIERASSSNRSSSDAFLVVDNADSSTEGVDESCGSEGHADSSSTNGSAGRDGDASDSDRSTSESTTLLPSFKDAHAPQAMLPDVESPPSQNGDVRRASVGSEHNTDPVRKTRSFRGSFGCARRPVRQQVMVPRKLPPRRSTSSIVLSPPEACLSPFGRAVPPVPEDFIGRAVDVWSVLQHLCERRAVVVCGELETDHGIGKSALLDAVHRAFALQMGGICVAVHLGALSDSDVASAASAMGWIDKVKTKVQLALESCQELWCRTGDVGSRPVAASLTHRHRSSKNCLLSGVLGGGGAQALRRRKPPPRQQSVAHGFHPLSDPIAVEPALEELVAVMSSLTDLCEDCSREWPAMSMASGGRASGARILLVLDECDHLIQQRHFQDAIADVLRRCASYSVVLSTQQQMVETGGGWFKTVHHPVAGLAPKDAARLFLRRAHRPLYWDELLSPAASADSNTTGEATAGLGSGATWAHRSPVVMTRENEAEVLARVAAHPAVAAQHGNPRHLIELASKVRVSLTHLSEIHTFGKPLLHEGV